jgi:hypothetical protein
MITPPKRISFEPWTAYKNREFKITMRVLSRYQPLTRRQLASKTPFEISTLCRILKHLTDTHGITKIAYIAKCSTTGKPVAHYALRNWRDTKNGR